MGSRGRNGPARACGICTMTDHPTDCCPTLQEEIVNAVGNFPGPPQRPYNPHSNTYNPGWRDHPILAMYQTQNQIRPINLDHLNPTINHKSPP
ncbi:hypothetical protein V6N13_059749 [Hibiscus sabdariffa]